MSQSWDLSKQKNYIHVLQGASEFLGRIPCGSCFRVRKCRSVCCTAPVPGYSAGGDSARCSLAKRSHFSTESGRKWQM